MLEQILNKYTTPLFFLDNITSATCIDEATSSEVGIQGETRSIVERVIWSIILFMIIMASLVGNLFVIVCVRLHHRLREEHANLFIINLSITDMGSAAMVMVSTLHAMASDKWLLGPVWCDIVCGVNYTFIVVSMITLCFIAVDRYLAIVHALHYHVRITRKRIYMMLGMAWIQGLFFGLVPILAHWIKYDYWEVICAIAWNMDRGQLVAFVTVGFTICFTIPSVVLVLAYCKVMGVARAQINAQPHVDMGPRLPAQVEHSSKTACSTIMNRQARNNDNMNFKIQNKDNIPTISGNIESNRVITSCEANTTSKCQDVHVNNNHTNGQTVSTARQLQHTIMSKRTSSKSLHGGTDEGQLVSCNGRSKNSNEENPFRRRNNGYFTENIDNHKSTYPKAGETVDADTETEIEILKYDDSDDESKQTSSKQPANEASQNLHCSSKIYNQRTEEPCSSTMSSQQIKKAVNFEASIKKDEDANSQKPSPKNTSFMTAMRRLKNKVGNSEDSMKPQKVTKLFRKSISSARLPKKSYAASNKAVKSLLIIVVVYFICMTPFCTTKLCKVLFPNYTLPGYVNLLSSIFQFCSSAINPLIYGIFRKDFQRAFMLLVKRVIVKLRMADSNINDFQSGSYN